MESRCQRQGQQDEAGQAPCGVRGGHQRDGTDDPIRELTLPSCGDIASRENAGRQCTSPCPRKTRGVRFEREGLAMAAWADSGRHVRANRCANAVRSCAKFSPQMSRPYMLEHKLRSRHRGRQMHTTAEISKLAESARPDQFIPVRKEDLFSALIKQGDL